MNPATRLQITGKGEDELKRRIYKLGMKKRSVLILLDQPQSIQHVLGKSVFPQREILEEIRALLGDQFIAVSFDGAAGSGPAPATRGPDAGVGLQGGIILSEAKFLLIDFCVDHFGTRSQTFVDDISACSKEQDLGFCLGQVLAAAQQQCPDRIPALLRVIREINETA